MMTYTIIAIITSVFSFISFYSSQNTKKELLSGKPSMLALMDYTGIYEKKELIEKFGRPDRDDFFKVSFEEVKKHKAKNIFNLLDNDIFESFCFIAPLFCLWGMRLNYDLAVALIVSCAVFQAINWGLAFIEAAKVISNNKGL